MIALLFLQTSYVYVWLNAVIIDWLRQQAQQFLQNQQLAPNSTTYKNVELGIEIIESRLQI